MDELIALTQYAAAARQQRYLRNRQPPAQADNNGSVRRGSFLGLDASRNKGRVQFDDGSVIDVAVLTTGEIMPGMPVLVRSSGGYNSITGVPR